jgi:hypothetical protein
MATLINVHAEKQCHKNKNCQRGAPFLQRKKPDQAKTTLLDEKNEMYCMPQIICTAPSQL